MTSTRPNARLTAPVSSESIPDSKTPTTSKQTWSRPWLRLHPEAGTRTLLPQAPSLFSFFSSFEGQHPHLRISMFPDFTIWLTLGDSPLPTPSTPKNIDLHDSTPALIFPFLGLRAD